MAVAYDGYDNGGLRMCNLMLNNKASDDVDDSDLAFENANINFDDENHVCNNNLMTIWQHTLSLTVIPPQSLGMDRKCKRATSTLGTPMVTTGSGSREGEQWFGFSFDFVPMRTIIKWQSEDVYNV